MKHQPGDIVYVPVAIQIGAGSPHYVPAWRAARQWGVHFIAVKHEWEAERADYPTQQIDRNGLNWTDVSWSAGRELSADWSPYEPFFRGVSSIDATLTAEGWQTRPACAMAAIKSCWADNSAFHGAEYKAPPIAESTGSALGDIFGTI